MRPVRAVPLLLAFAAGLHLAVLPSHLEEGLVVGAFFLLVAIGQLAAAALVHRGANGRARAVIAAGNLGVVAVWAVSRTVGLSLGGHGGAPEPIALLDALSVVGQLAAVVGLSLRAMPRPARSPRLAGLPALAAVMLLAGVAGFPFAEAAHAHEHEQHEVGRHHAPARLSADHVHAHDHEH
jgi:hypothetical protein